jgi:hypothetical protein
MGFFDYDKDTTIGLLDRMLRGQQGVRQRQRSEWYGPRAEGRELPIKAQLDAVARRDARIAELNRRVPEPGIIEKAVAAIADVVTPVPQTEIARAVAFLTETLKLGPLSQKDVEQRAQKAGIKWRTLKRAKYRAGVTSKRIGTSHWVWALPTA